MELAYAFLAKYADTAPDGTFTLIGGGLEGVKASSLPTGIPAMALIIHLLANPDECGHEHQLDMAFFSPTGAPILNPGGHLTFTPTEDPDTPGHRVGVSCIFGMIGMTFTEFGDYEFRLSLDGVPSRSVVISVRKGPSVG